MIVVVMLEFAAVDEDGVRVGAEGLLVESIDNTFFCGSARGASVPLCAAVRLCGCVTVCLCDCVTVSLCPYVYAYRISPNLCSQYENRGEIDGKIVHIDTYSLRPSSLP